MTFIQIPPHAIQRYTVFVCRSLDGHSFVVNYDHVWGGWVHNSGPWRRTPDQMEAMRGRYPLMVAAPQFVYGFTDAGTAYRITRSHD